MNKILNADCIDALKQLSDNSIDALITDPPAGISFMGKEWDHHKGGRKEWCAWMEQVMRECLRVMKPGAHGLVWALPRTSHWTATALEDAGFEIRDVVTHLFGSGFPKSHDISKAIDKAAGAEREVTKIGKSKPEEFSGKFDNRDSSLRERRDTPTTDAAKQWDGWGTALKPASEHWILVRKPISEKTVAANVLKWGVGGLNIDGCRIEANKRSPGFVEPKSELGYHKGSSNKNLVNWDASQGRFPANLILSHSEHCTDTQCDIECAIKMLDGQSGVPRASKQKIGAAPRRNVGFRLSATSADRSDKIVNYATDGNQGASRFFYCAKASKADKNAGLEELPNKEKRSAGGTTSSGKPSMQGRDRFGCVTKNHHPTVKSTKLMSYLIKLVTPPNGIVLDPFMGSGSTGVAAKKEGFGFIGIEREKEYFEIAEKRISAQSISY